MMWPESCLMLAPFFLDIPSPSPQLAPSWSPARETQDTRGVLWTTSDSSYSPTPLSYFLLYCLLDMELIWSQVWPLLPSICLLLSVMPEMISTVSMLLPTKLWSPRGGNQIFCNIWAPRTFLMGARSVWWSRPLESNRLEFTPLFPQQLGNAFSSAKWQEKWLHVAEGHVENAFVTWNAP